MVRVIVQVRELVSSNVGAMVESATDPLKMLRSLRREIEDADVALHGELAKLRRQGEAASADAAALDRKAKNWSEKAKIAMDNDREDLARAALLAREDVKDQAEAKRSDAKALASDAKEAETTLAKLQVKLSETADQMREHQNAVTPATPAAATPSHRRMDRISAMERRVDHALDGKSRDDATAARPADIEAEIASMQRDSNIDAELAALKSSKPKKAKARTSKRG